MKDNSVKSSLSNKYQPTEIEAHWQEVWEKERTYHPDIERAKKPYFALMMFPYPSAEGMHVGNMYAFTGSDLHGRFKRMQGYDVLEPIGLDGFGIHSENYALKIGKHPMDQAQIAEKNFYRQLRAIGNGFDWERTVETYNPEYYKWTQWLFAELFKAGLAYRKKAPVNFCPSCKTVLADEQVIDGLCERCSSMVEKKDLEQWFFRITDYAESLLTHIPDLKWAEKVRVAQKKWIGKSEGATIKFKVQSSTLPAGRQEFKVGEEPSSIEVFTTRPDTLYGVTFLVIAPEHPLVAILLKENKGSKEVQEYITAAKKRNQQDRSMSAKDKTGVFSGLYAIHPLTEEKLPVWIADYVLTGYGTGAIMAVPAHDERDFAFAKEYNLPIKQVVESDSPTSNEVYTGEGRLINSGKLDGLVSSEAKKQVVVLLEANHSGESQITYHLRDWLISRQRYWGAPIPMIHCLACERSGKSWFDTDEAKEYKESRIKNQELRARTTKDMTGWAAGWYPVPQEQLPVLLPHIDDYKPLGSGKSPLASHKEFYETVCPGCGEVAARETDVADTFLDSSWYFLRYTSTDIVDAPFSQERVRSWLPVNMYIGGAEHSVLHLLYARFVTMVLHDLGMIDFDEPFSEFYAHGLLIKEGAKMSKSKGNVIIPDEYIKKYGADTLRTYLMFLGPFNIGGDFYDTGIEGIYKFLKRVWHLVTTSKILQIDTDTQAISLRQEVIKGVTEDMESLRYNTAIAKMMTYYNYLAKRDSLAQQDITTFLQLLAPFAPHMTEELWQRVEVLKEGKVSKVSKGENKRFDSIHLSTWPKYDEKLLEQTEQVIAIQVNGKLRGSMPISESVSHDEKTVAQQAQQLENVSRHITGKTIRKTIYVPGKIINFVTD